MMKCALLKMCLLAVAWATMFVGYASDSLAATRVPLEILEPAERVGGVHAFPATLGMIFLEGELTSAPGGAVVDDLGNHIPFDCEVTAWWSAEKKSIKWLLLHFKASSDRQYFFEVGKSATTPQGTRLAEERDGSIVIDTGPLKATLVPGNAPVFESVQLNGKAMLQPGASLFEMVDDEGQPLKCEDWTLTLEHNTPYRAVVKAEGVMRVPGDSPMAKISVRYQFYADEGFVRMHHTFIWMKRSLDPGASRIGLRLKPTLGKQGVVRVGRSDYTDKAEEVALSPEMNLVAYQDTVDHFTVRKNNKTLVAGKHLGGWISIEDQQGRGIGVSLKDAWQTYPTALSVRDGDLDIGLWPEEAGRFSFEEREIMPDSLYYSRYWKNQTSWAKEGGPSEFNMKDIEPDHAIAYFDKLKKQAAASAPSPGKRIVSLLRPELQKRLQERATGSPVSDGFRARIAHGMNAFVRKPVLYDAAAWQGVQLKLKAKQLLDRGVDTLDKPHLFWFNRLLIESAFPESISPTDVPHHIHENDDWARGGNYIHHGQGAARTHEVTVLFYDQSSKRTPAQINSLTQHPFVMRQSPDHAMRARFFSFKFSAKDAETYPDIERGLDHFGRASVARYAQVHDYGFLRYGMQRMHFPGRGLYRWFAGMQYDQQIIPWLMFIRGGDRIYYEEAMATTRFTMDMQTNHYNSLGTPPGYMSYVASMPIPESTAFRDYNMKIHFLSLCHHLTGYQRANEVMHMTIDGYKKLFPSALESGNHMNRQLYGAAMFTCHVYQETHDPAVKELARKCLDRILDSHYDADHKLFMSNTQYLYRALLSLYEILPEERLRQAMMEHLDSIGIPRLQWAGIDDSRPGLMAAACAWGYEQTGDERYIQVIWNLTRSLADVAPEHDWSSPEPVEYPKGDLANYAHRVLPMLVGLGVVDGKSIDLPKHNILHDMYVTINRPGGTGEVFVRSQKDGDLQIRCKANPLRSDHPVSITAYRVGSDVKVAESTMESHTQMLFPDLRSQMRHSTFKGKITIPNTREGDVYRLTFKGGAQTTGILVLCEDAQIVHRITSDTIQIYSHGYQYYPGTRVFVKMKDDTLKIWRIRLRAPITIRDAQTRELLYRSTVTDPRDTEYKIEKGRMLELVLGAGVDNYWRFEGIEPFISARLKDWFVPTQQAGTQ